eukprot:CAMPEP_0183802414 /NCGR_PEP_ID=MMETSP0803_2-20130417/30306_1 /TAXON_ID=195967 /ORGANISM="Crustomastix stigmata, Strain CCMP3273" /LENGTH=72 /DNA_ID=CAMNT_0026047145 /DNA_START=54 /DNA_END=268 /DNA_ORIENTATION=-
MSCALQKACTSRFCRRTSLLTCTTAGGTLAMFTSSHSCSTLKLLTPMALALPCFTASSAARHASRHVPSGLG